MKKYIKTVIHEYQGMLKDVRLCYMRFIKYQLMTKFIIGIILMPTFKILLTYILKSAGRTSVHNGVLLKYLMSPQGIISIVITLLLAISVVLIEIGGLIIISQQAYRGEKESSYGTVMVAALKHFKHLMGAGGLLVLLYIVIMAPILGIGYQSSLVESVELPGFIEDYINQSTLLSTIHTVLIILVVVISIRWIFAIHYIILDNRSPWKALRASRKVMKKKWKSFLGLTLGVNLLMLFVAFLLFVVTVAIGFGVLYLMNLLEHSQDGTTFAIAGFISLIFIYLLVVSFVVLPTEIHFFTRMYYRFSGKEPKPLNLKPKTGKGIWLNRWLAKPAVMTIVVVVGSIVSSIIVAFVFLGMEDEYRQVQVTAHRGSSIEAPENTLSAIEAAIQNGADYVEIDVQRTKDDRLILLHDSSFKRTAGSLSSPSEMTLDEVKVLDVGSWFGEEYAGEQVPTLQEVIDYVQGRIRLNIEIKGLKDDDILVKKVVEAVKKNGLLDTCVVTSLSYDIIQKVEALEKRIRTGYIMFVAIGDLKELNVDFYSVEMSNVSESFVAKAHMFGRQVHVWTINETEDMEDMMLLGVDNVITDYDAQMKAFVESYNQDFWTSFIGVTSQIWE